VLLAIKDRPRQAGPELAEEDDDDPGAGAAREENEA
jgi:hypothetical protein